MIYPEWELAKVMLIVFTPIVEDWVGNNCPDPEYTDITVGISFKLWVKFHIDDVVSW